MIASVIPTFKKIFENKKVRKSVLFVSEFGILIVLIPLLASLLKTGSPVELPIMYRSEVPWLIEIGVQGINIILLELHFAILVLIIFFLGVFFGKSRFLPFVIIIALGLFLFFSYKHSHYFHDFVETLRSKYNQYPSFFSTDTQILIPSSFHQLGTVGIWMTGLLFGLLATVHKFTSIRFMIGWLFGISTAILCCRFFQLNLFEVDDLIYFLAWIAFGWVMISFDAFRSPLTQITGIDFSVSNDDAQASNVAPKTTVFMSCLSVFSATILVVMIGYSNLQHRFFESMAANEQSFILPQGRNGADYLRGKFSLEAQYDQSGHKYDLFPELTLIYNEKPDLYTKSEYERFLNLIDKHAPEYQESEGELLQLYYDELVRVVNESEYYQQQTTDNPDNIGFLIIRSVMRSLYGKAVTLMHQGKTDEALEIAELILDFAYVFSNDLNPTITHIAIGRSLRDYPLEIIKFGYFKNRDNTKNLRKLKNFLIEKRDKFKYVFPYNNLKQGEPSTWYIVPFAEIVTPAFSEYVLFWYKHWNTYDQLLVAIALESHTHDQGGYPNRLQELVPDYLNEVPVDVILNKPLPYRKTDSTFIFDYPKVQWNQKSFHDQFLTEEVQKSWSVVETHENE